TRMRNLTADMYAFDERSLQRDAEPAAELPGVGQRAPHPRPRGAQHNFFLDSIGRRCDHMQPPGCLTIRDGESICNLRVAYWRWRRRRQASHCAGELHRWTLAEPDLVDVGSTTGFAIATSCRGVIELSVLEAGRCRPSTWLR